MTSLLWVIILLFIVYTAVLALLLRDYSQKANAKAKDLKLECQTLHQRVAELNGVIKGLEPDANAAALLRQTVEHLEKQVTALRGETFHYRLSDDSLETYLVYTAGELNLEAVISSKELHELETKDILGSNTRKKHIADKLTSAFRKHLLDRFYKGDF